MHGLLSLFLAGATLAGPADDQAPKPKISVSVMVSMPDGKTGGATRRFEVGPEPLVLFVYGGKSLCDATTVTTGPPTNAGTGWTLALEQPVYRVFSPTAPAAPVPAAIAMLTPLRVTWQRVWEGGKENIGPTRTSTLALTPGIAVPLDTIDGEPQAVSAEAAARLKQWRRGDAVPYELQNDGRIFALLDSIAERQLDRLRLKAVAGLGNLHPRIVEIDVDIAFLRKQLDDRVQLLITRATAGPGIGGGGGTCHAVSMNLLVEAVEPEGDVQETELWLVHRDPAGKETTQRQVVRSRGNGSATFYFDDTKVQTSAGAINIEMYGSVSLASCCGGKLFPTIALNRRYSTTSPKFSWRTRGGEVTYQPQAVNGETVSLQLPPLSDDDGALVGHRFSLRVRVKVLQ